MLILYAIVCEIGVIAVAENSLKCFECDYD